MNDPSGKCGKALFMKVYSATKKVFPQLPVEVTQLILSQNLRLQIYHILSIQSHENLQMYRLVVQSC